MKPCNFICNFLKEETNGYRKFTNKKYLLKSNEILLLLFLFTTIILIGIFIQRALLACICRVPVRSRVGGCVDLKL